MEKKKVNSELQKLIEKLRHTAAKEGVILWKVVASELAGSSTKRRVVNISKLSYVTKPNETVLVPGKVLAGGDITIPLQIAAYQFSKEARQKIEDAKGKALTLVELMDKNPKAKEVRIIG